MPYPRYDAVLTSDHWAVMVEDLDYVFLRDVQLRVSIPSERGRPLHQVSGQLHHSSKVKLILKKISLNLFQMSIAIVFKYFSGDSMTVEVPEELTQRQLYHAVWQNCIPPMHREALVLFKEGEEMLSDDTPIIPNPEETISVLIQDCYVMLQKDCAVDAIYQHGQFDKYVIHVMRYTDGIVNTVGVYPFYHSQDGRFYVDVEVLDQSDAGEIINLFRSRMLWNVEEVLPAPHNSDDLQQQLLKLWNQRY